MSQRLCEYSTLIKSWLVARGKVNDIIYEFKTGFFTMNMTGVDFKVFVT